MPNVVPSARAPLALHSYDPIRSDPIRLDSWKQQQDIIASARDILT